MRAPPSGGSDGRLAKRRLQNIYKQQSTAQVAGRERLLPLKTCQLEPENCLNRGTRLFLSFMISQPWPAQPLLPEQVHQNTDQFESTVPVGNGPAYFHVDVFTCSSSPFPPLSASPHEPPLDTDLFLHSSCSIRPSELLPVHIFMKLISNFWLWKISNV